MWLVGVALLRYCTTQTCRELTDAQLRLICNMLIYLCTSQFNQAMDEILYRLLNVFIFLKTKNSTMIYSNADGAENVATCCCQAIWPSVYCTVASWNHRTILVLHKCSITSSLNHCLFVPFCPSYRFVLHQKHFSVSTMLPGSMARFPLHEELSSALRALCFLIFRAPARPIGRRLELFRDYGWWSVIALLYHQHVS